MTERVDTLTPAQLKVKSDDFVLNLYHDRCGLLQQVFSWPRFRNKVLKQVKKLEAELERRGFYKTN